MGLDFGTLDFGLGLDNNRLISNQSPKHVALLAVGAALEHLGRHPGGAALVVGHHRALVARRAEVADLQREPVVD